MGSVTDMLDRMREQTRRKNAPRKRNPSGRKTGISGFGHGKWQTRASLAAYRRRRDKARKVARAARRLNRQR